jgi:poly-gamma-glutamate synthesis protein (capsule biosynthesis protein)
LGDGYVAYGLGNYAWYTQGSAATSVTGVLTLTVQPPPSRNGRAAVTDAVWEPARIGADGLPTPMARPAATRFDADRGTLRACADLAS